MGKAWQGMWQGAGDGERKGGRAAAAARHVPSGFAACNPCNKNSSVPLEFVHPSHFPPLSVYLHLSLLLTPFVLLSVSPLISLINYTRIAFDFDPILINF